MAGKRAFTLFLFCGGFAMAEKTVTFIELKDLPPAVRKIADREAQSGAKLGRLEREVIDGEIFYEIQLSMGGKGRELLLRPDGSLVETEEEMAIESIPTGAQKAIREAAKNGKLIKVDLIKQGNRKLYEGEVRENGKTRGIRFDSDGRAAK